MAAHGAYLLTLCGLQIILPEVNVQAISFRHCRSPDLTSAKTNTVNRLRLLTVIMGMGIGIDECAMNTLDNTPLTPDIPGDAGMSGWIDIASHNMIAWAKARYRPACLSLG
jgi:hypothetical protein